MLCLNLLFLDLLQKGVAVIKGEELSRVTIFGSLKVFLSEGWGLFNILPKGQSVINILKVLDCIFRYNQIPLKYQRHSDLWGGY